MRARRFGGGFFVFGLLALGCGGADPGIPQTQIEGQWHRAICDREVRCGRMPDVQTCLGATASPVSAQLAADLASGRVAYDPQAGKALVADAAATPCGIMAATSRSTAVADLARLRTTFQGRVPLGGVCGADEQCAGSTFCDLSIGGTSCGGSCNFSSAPTPASLPTTPGASCQGPGACGGDLACVPSNANPICTTLALPGGACDASLATPCDDPTTYCDSTTKTCLPRVPVGAPCSVFDQSCVAFAACDATSDVCVALAGAGGQCKELGIECLGDLRCADATSPCALPAQPPTCP